MNDEASQTPNPGQGPTPPPPPPGGFYRPPPPPPQPPRRKTWLWAIPISLAVGCLPWLILVGLGIGAIFTGFSSFSSFGGVSDYGSHVALIRVSGVIMSGRSESGLFSGTSAGSDDLIEQLERARKNDDVKAIVLRINSPGGSPAASEEVYKEILRVRADHKVVYTSMADVAASGGYYIASASDQIYADASTLTGSIGVIWDITDMSGLYKKVGFNPQVVKSGKFKDIGSPNRPLTPDERALLQGIVMETYGQFVKAVSDGRHIPVEDVKKIADGRVFTGSQAIRVKLVDKLGGLHETVRAAGRASGIRGEPKVIEYKRHRGFSDIFSTESERASSDAERAIGKQLIDQLVNGKGSASGLR
jgi:protease-4